MRCRRLLGLFWMLLLAGLTAAISKAPAQADLNLRDLNGRRVKLRDYRGKIVVLNFWATWCGPCKVEMPLLSAAEKEYGPKGAVFVAASLDDPKNVPEISAFLNAHHVSLTTWVGATADDLDKLEMGPAVPATAFLDQEGHIVARILGQMRDGELQERLDWMMGTRLTQPEVRVSHLEK